MMVHMSKQFTLTSNQTINPDEPAAARMNIRNGHALNIVSMRFCVLVFYKTHDKQTQMKQNKINLFQLSYVNGPIAGCQSRGTKTPCVGRKQRTGKNKQRAYII